MRIVSMLQGAASVLLWPGLVWAGPPIACHEFVTTPGSLFESLEPLRSVAMVADDSPADKEAARQRLRELRAAIEPGNPVSLLKAAYWAEVLRAVGVDRQADGTALILKALELRPNDPEYHFIAALAFLPRDQATFQKHWDRARALAIPGSAVARNLQVFGDLLLGAKD